MVNSTPWNLALAPIADGVGVGSRVGVGVGSGFGKGTSLIVAAGVPVGVASRVGVDSGAASGSATRKSPVPELASIEQATFYRISLCCWLPRVLLVSLPPYS